MFCSPSGEALAGMVKLVDTPGLGPGERKLVQVQVLFPAPHTTLGGDLKSQILNLKYLESRLRHGRSRST